MLLPPGNWRAGPWVRLEKQGDGFRAYAPNAVLLVPGGTADARFDVRINQRKLKVIGPDGQPAKGVQLWFRRNGEHTGAICKRTDSDGLTTVTTSPGTLEPWTNIRSLTSEDAYRKWLEENRTTNAAARGNITVVLQEITVPGPELEIRLPPDWDR